MVTVTLKMTTREFDLTRQAVKALQQETFKIIDDHEADPAVKRAARQRAVEINDLVAKLGA